MSRSNQELVTHPKSSEQRDRIKACVLNNLLFKNLDPSQLDKVLNVMFEVNAKTGEEVIKQGDDGDNFYVVESGQFQVVRNSKVVNLLGIQ